MAFFGGVEVCIRERNLSYKFIGGGGGVFFFFQKKNGKKIWVFFGGNYKKVKVFLKKIGERKNNVIDQKNNIRISLQSEKSISENREKLNGLHSSKKT